MPNSLPNSLPNRETIKRAAIPIMVNNSLLSEVYCQNRLAPNKRTDLV
jgi:hypothetical protein